MLTINRVVYKQLSRVAVFIMLFVVFRTLFFFATPYYLPACSNMDTPIDAHATCPAYFFDAAYVQEAKDFGYDHAVYFKLYVPLDIIFPVIYTSMFLSLLLLYKRCKIYKYLRWLIIAGCVFDYLENSSFSLFMLLKGSQLAPVVAFFTTIKTFLFVFNIVVFLAALAGGIVLLFKTGTKITAL